MDLSADKIRKVAKLAKISLTDSEVLMFDQQFRGIISVIEKLQNVDTTNVEPIHNPSQNKTLFRDDMVNDGNKAEEIVVNAPKQAFNCFVVPKVVE